MRLTMYANGHEPMYEIMDCTEDEITSIYEILVRCGWCTFPLKDGGSVLVNFKNCVTLSITDD